MTRKRGKLSNGEMDYIRQNCFDLSIEEIAETLNRTTGPINKFIDKENLKARDLTDHEYMLTHLRDRYYYKELGKQFSDGELIFFEHQWIDFCSWWSKRRCRMTSGGGCGTGGPGQWGFLGTCFDYEAVSLRKWERKSPSRPCRRSRR